MLIFSQHGWLAVVAVVVAVGYVIWLGYRRYMALGSCPKCQRWMHRAVEICEHCGCRRTEYQARRR